MQLPETLVSFDEILDSMMQGAQFLQTTFDIKTDIGWQMTSIGHSAAFADLLSQMNYSSLFISRVPHHTDRFNWQTSSEPLSTTMLDHTLLQKYLPELHDFLRVRSDTYSS